MVARRPPRLHRERRGHPLLGQLQRFHAARPAGGRLHPHRGRRWREHRALRVPPPRLRGGGDRVHAGGGDLRHLEAGRRDRHLSIHRHGRRSHLLRWPGCQRQRHLLAPHRSVRTHCLHPRHQRRQRPHHAGLLRRVHHRHRGALLQDRPEQLQLPATARHGRSAGHRFRHRSVAAGGLDGRCVRRFGRIDDRMGSHRGPRWRCHGPQRRPHARGRVPGGCLRQHLDPDRLQGCRRRLERSQLLAVGQRLRFVVVRHGQRVHRTRPRDDRARRMDAGRRRGRPHQRADAALRRWRGARRPHSEQDFAAAQQSAPLDRQQPRGLRGPLRSHRRHRRGASLEHGAHGGPDRGGRDDAARRRRARSGAVASAGGRHRHDRRRWQRQRTHRHDPWHR